MAKSAKRKVKRNVAKAVVHIKATFNNTLITVADPDGDTICACSSGCVGFKGSRKSTPYAAGLAARSVARAAMDNGMQEADVIVKGPGPGRESAIRAVSGAGLSLRSISDITAVPHNGCRPPKKRRV